MKDRDWVWFRRSGLMAVLFLLLAACGGAQSPATPTSSTTATTPAESSAATVALATDTPELPSATVDPPTATAVPPTATSEPVALYKGAEPGVNEDGAPTLGSADAPVVMIGYSDFL
ncbi:MAG: hypothetical protein MI924_08980 [Chloroflexales bacterium]|nr:hypothetical protein [Chloroflexales bacterium]